MPESKLTADRLLEKVRDAEFFARYARMNQREDIAQRWDVEVARLKALRS